jgi:ornithine cyclodeaminase/alanine dehydrogenase-like protein (mu-crystallin family)
MAELLNVEVSPADSAQACVKEADIVITMTTSPTPVLLGAWVEPGMHINVMGSNHWTRREVDDDVIRRANTVVVDSIAEAKSYSGDLLFTIDRGLIRWEQVHELVSVAAGKVPGRPSNDAITLFKSHGIGISDVAAAAYVYRKAKAQGLGTELPLSA